MSWLGELFRKKSTNDNWLLGLNKIDSLAKRISDIESPYLYSKKDLVYARDRRYPESYPNVMENGKVVDRKFEYKHDFWGHTYGKRENYYLVFDETKEHFQSRWYLESDLVLKTQPPKPKPVTRKRK